MDRIKLSIGPLFGGILFALGLGISGMTEPAKIIGFLNLFDDWNPSLIFVMIGAIGVHAIFHKFIVRKPTPLFESKFFLPTQKDVDLRLITGSAIFGIGWGVTGLCPGPGVTSLSTANPYAVTFVLTLILGMVIGKRIVAHLDKVKVR